MLIYYLHLWYWYIVTLWGEYTETDETETETMQSQVVKSLILPMPSMTIG